MTPDATLRRMSADLYELTRHLAENGHEAAHGVLGGVWGYGAEYRNDVFEMHPFWWGECQCGHEEAEIAWEKANPHTAACYQTEMQRRDWQGDLAAVAREWGLPEFGCAVHCTCGQKEKWRRWAADHPHPDTCPEVRPNFRHHRTGVEIRWYKWIGRSMEVTGSVSLAAWQAVMDECMDSVKRVVT